jgi:Zn-dependent protease with chaperone function
MKSSFIKGVKREINKQKEAKVYKLSPDIELKQTIGNQIYDALQGHIVEQVLRKTKISSRDAYFRSMMEGHSMKIDANILGDLYSLCQEVVERLDFRDDVDFYITGDSAVNAFSVASEEDDEPHIVNINSALFDLMTRDELKFVIGHELGHLICKDTELRSLISFVFPEDSEVPVLLQHKIRLHEQLAELVADRYGFLATRDLSVCVTAFFKLASGLDLNKMNVSIESLIADNNKRLEYFMNDKGLSRATHPVNPIRVQALNLYATSKSQRKLENGMNDLISILLKVGDSELDEWMARFIASAGLITATIDNKLSEREFEEIIENLANVKIFPSQYLDKISKGDVGEMFNESVENIMKLNPAMKTSMLGYMISIVMSDNAISTEEIEFLYNFGASVGFSDVEVAMYIADAIQKHYVPSLESIS